MAKNKVSKSIARVQVDTKAKPIFFRRFVFESIFIVFITTVLLWLTSFVDVPGFAMTLSSDQRGLAIR